jgi:hypothetical protein
MAQNNLGFLYRDGHGVPQDYAEALRWYRMAADQGYATAQNNVGANAAEGLGMVKDCVVAKQWFEAAAARGDETARNNPVLCSNRHVRAVAADAINSNLIEDQNLVDPQGSE